MFMCCVKAYCLDEMYIMFTRVMDEILRNSDLVVTFLLGNVLAESDTETKLIARY